MFKQWKVYLTVEGSPNEEQIRIFRMDTVEMYGLAVLKTQLQYIFPILHGQRYTITWKDAEGDHITILTDDDLGIALTESTEKFYITLHAAKENDHYVQPEEIAGVLHHNVICDGCDNNVKGFRYKCIECPDYDLCFECEAKALHPEHCMIRMAVPLQWNLHHVRRLAHRMKKTLRKRTPSDPREEVARKCLPMRQRYNGRPKPNCDTSSWMDTFADYFNDYYAGECPMKNNVPKPPETATEATASSNEQPPKQTKKEAKPHIDLLKIVEDNIAQLLSPFGIDISMKVKNDENSNVKQTNAATTQANAEPTLTTNKDEPTKFPGKGQDLIETQNHNIPTSTIETLTNKDDSSLEKPGKSSDDEWILLAKDERSSQSTPSANMQASPLPCNSCQPVNESTQKQATNPSAPPTDESNGNLYPSLSKPVQQEIIYHPDPKIQKAVETMISMGFNNESGWLTQLLVIKDGDIEKVLDTLNK